MYRTTLALAIGAMIFAAGSTAASASCTYHIKLFNDTTSNITIANVGTKKTTGKAHKAGNVDDFVVTAKSAALTSFGSVKRKTNTDIYFGVQKKGGSWFWASEKASCHDSYVRRQNDNPIKIFLN